MDVPEGEPLSGLVDRVEYERQLRELVASLDEAEDELDRDGPVPPEELRRALLEVFAEGSREQKPE